MKYLICFLFLSIFYNCKPEPNYNPFDEEFDISLRKLKHNGIDTLSMDCGYITMEELNNKRFKVYYQTYQKSSLEDEVVAKGFTYYIDTLRNIERNEFYTDKIKDSLKKIKFNLTEINNSLKMYNRTILKEENEFKILNKKNKDTLKLKLNINFYEKDTTIIRTLNFMKGKSN